MSICYEFTMEEAERVWLISDTHFDHTNIIHYCGRPFQTVEEMNNTIFKNWNIAINPRDIVYFLGDMAFGRGSRSPRWWARQLNGKIVWTKGSHDRGIRPSSEMTNVRVADFEYVMVNGLCLLLIHDALDYSINGWTGWIIHGHNHDNQPFLNVPKKRVNVSVEAINYKPVSLAEVMRGIIRGVSISKRGDN